LVSAGAGDAAGSATGRIGVGGAPAWVVFCRRGVAARFVGAGGVAGVDAPSADAARLRGRLVDVVASVAAVAAGFLAGAVGAGSAVLAAAVLPAALGMALGSGLMMLIAGMDAAEGKSMFRATARPPLCAPGWADATTGPAWRSFQYSA